MVEIFNKNISNFPHQKVDLSSSIWAFSLSVYNSIKCQLLYEILIKMADMKTYNNSNDGEHTATATTKQRSCHTRKFQSLSTRFGVARAKVLWCVAKIAPHKTYCRTEKSGHVDVRPARPRKRRTTGMPSKKRPAKKKESWRRWTKSRCLLCDDSAGHAKEKRRKTQAIFVFCCVKRTARIAPQKWKHSRIHLCNRDNKRAQKKSIG